MKIVEERISQCRSVATSTNIQFSIVNIQSKKRGGKMKTIAKTTTQFGVIWLICFGLLGLQPAWAATNISSTYKYAWSENVGWQNWRSTNAQATVGTTYLVGYVWAENIGWIKLGSTPVGGTYPNTTSTNWGVNRNSSTGALSGYAWSENVGWINFDSTNSQVVIATDDGKFDGYAWGENVGYIHFQNASPAEYYVQQDGALVVELVSFSATAFEDHIILKWETASEIDNAGFHLWRTETEDAEYSRITDYLIPAEGGPAQGTEYSYEDFDVVSGLTYYYQLEDIDYAGVSTFHGPVSATLSDEAIALIFPEDGALIPAYPPTAFEWDGAGLERFKLNFSTDPDFESKVVVLQRGYKRHGRWITGESYTPNRKEWRSIRRLGRKGRTVYWAVYGEDKAGKGFVSKTFQLKIEDY
ncbi:MAG: hypothetical protein C4B58_10935 [Deltaproteobacteria bacterium]|nr:MAG: hypothetical protein C4B58_10935 [Deltaproteobacteria bacterium]